MVTDRPLADFVAQLATKDKLLTFSRWGDGEWNSVLGTTKKRNCDGHQFFPRMGIELKAVLLSRPSYMLGLQPLARKLFDKKLTQWLVQNKVHDLNWVNADVFHQASQKGELGPLLDVLRSKPLVVVGPPHLAKLKNFLGYKTFVVVPPKDAYLGLVELTREVLAAVDRLPPGSIISVSASMPAKILIHSLHRRNGVRHHIVDFGSLWDCYAGVKSRRYMQGMDVEAKDAT